VLPSTVCPQGDKRVASGDYAAPGEYLLGLNRPDQLRERHRAIGELLLRRRGRAGAVDMDAADFRRIRRRLLRRVRGAAS